MIQTLTVTTKGEVYWTVDVTDSESVHRDGEDIIFRRMHERAERLRAVLADPDDEQNDRRSSVGHIVE